MAPRKPSVVSILVIALTLLFVLGSLFFPVFFDPIDLRLYDAAMSLTSGGKGSESRVVLIEIDRRSVKALGSWPWPRQLLGDLLTILRHQGAKAVGLLLPLAEREGNRALTGVRAFKEKFDVYSFSKKDEGLRDWVLERLRETEESLDSDRMLVERTRQAGNVVLPLFLDHPGEERGADPLSDRVLKKNTLGDAGLPLPRMEKGSSCGGVFPFTELSEAALGVGHAGLSAKSGMEGRSHPLFIECQGGLLPSFSLRAAMALLGANPNQVFVEPSRLRLQDFSVPLWDGEMLVPFRDRGPERRSFAEILQGGKVPVSVEGKCVLIGLNLGDSLRVDTPLSPAMPAVEFHARAIDSILSKDFIQRPRRMIYLEAAAVAVIGLAAAFLLVGIPHGIRFAGTFALLVLVLGAEYVLFSQGLWLRSGAVALFVVILSVTLTLAHLVRDARAGGSTDTHRLLGIGFQREGLLDQAFAEFRQLPMNGESRDLLYQLGTEHEKRGMNDQALGVYEQLNRHGEFRDVAERVRRLRKADLSSADAGFQSPEEDRTAQEEPGAEEPRITRVGRYEIIQELGKGSMGLVYKALDPKLNRMLAVKTIRFSDEFDPEVIQEIKGRFLREAEIAGRLSHPGIVTVYDVGEDRDLTYMAMELLEGEDLEKHIAPEALLPLRRVLEVVASVADALNFAHKAGVIHRDIKPANIMLLRHGGVKVTDFGIAKAMSSTRTRTGIILGTPNYMSPEQIMGQRIDYRSDIFSLGVLFFQLLTGELPFRADNLSSLLNQITQVRHASVRERNARVPKVCDQLIDKALAKNPNDRFSSAGEFCRLTRMVISKMDELRRKG